MIWIIGAAILVAALGIASAKSRREDYAVPTLKIFSGCK